MKIISKHKDYYDWAVSIYGIDPIMVYDRRNSGLERPFQDIPSINRPVVTKHEFSICNRIYIVYQFMNKFYHTVDELVELHNILDENNIDDRFLTKHRYGYDGIDIRQIAEMKFKEWNTSSDVNMSLRKPVLLKTIGGKFEYITQHTNRFWQDSDKKDKSSWSLPDLSLYGFAKWYDAQQIFQDIYAFISWTKDNPEIPNNQTNDEKIHSNGFDTKSSFRPNMK
jgi:hypothetical protein